MDPIASSMENAENVDVVEKDLTAFRVTSEELKKSLAALFNCRMSAQGTYRFSLSNARRFYSSMGNPLAGKGLTIWKQMKKSTWRMIGMLNSTVV